MKLACAETPNPKNPTICGPVRLSDFFRPLDFGFRRQADFRNRLKSMFLATINKPKQLLHLSFIHQVKAEELQQARENVIMLLADLTSGFRLLSDLGRLDSMDVNCAAEIGKMMELCDEKGVALVVR